MTTKLRSEPSKEVSQEFSTGLHGEWNKSNYWGHSLLLLGICINRHIHAPLIGRLEINED